MLKEILVDQGTEEWLHARLGVITGSKIGKCFTSKGNISEAGSKTLARELAAEELHKKSNIPMVSYTNVHMERGNALEEEAFNAYVFSSGQQYKKIGFLLDKDRGVGCSPDGVLFDGHAIKEGIEIKCPMAKTHIAYLDYNGLPTDYEAQVRWNLWTSKSDKFTFVSYFPGAKLFQVEVLPDNEWEEKFQHVIENVTKIKQHYMQICEG